MHVNTQFVPLLAFAYCGVLHVLCKRAQGSTCREALLFRGLIPDELRECDCTRIRFTWRRGHGVTRATRWRYRCWGRVGRGEGNWSRHGRRRGSRHHLAADVLVSGARSHVHLDVVYHNVRLSTSCNKKYFWCVVLAKKKNLSSGGQWEFARSAEDPQTSTPSRFRKGKGGDVQSRNAWLKIL